MPFAKRKLENGDKVLLQNTLQRDLELFEPASQYLTSNPVYQIYQKTDYNWANRTGITMPDITFPFSTSGLVISNTDTAGTLVIAADGTVGSMVIGIAIVLWDELGNPISVNSGMITLSGWCKNASGNYIAANGFGTAPGFLAIDVSLAAGYTVLVQSIIPSGTVNLHWKLF